MRKQATAGLVRALSVLLAIGLAACVDIPGVKEAPPRLYVLTPKSTYPANLPTVDWQLLVETPVSAAGLSSARIALQDSPIELRYFDNANWTDFAPKMVQSLIIESFENSGKIVSVGREQIGLRSDFVLKTELREFQAEYEEPIPAKYEGAGARRAGALGAGAHQRQARENAAAGDHRAPDFRAARPGEGKPHERDHRRIRRSAGQDPERGRNLDTRDRRERTNQRRECLRK